MNDHHSSHPDWHHPFPGNESFPPPNPSDRAEVRTRNRLRRFEREHLLPINSVLNTAPIYKQMLRHPAVWWPLTSVVVLLMMTSVVIPSGVFSFLFGTGNSAPVIAGLITFGFMIAVRPRHAKG